jgi:hypothetical protein
MSCGDLGERVVRVSNSKFKDYAIALPWVKRFCWRIDWLRPRPLCVWSIWLCCGSIMLERSSSNFWRSMYDLREIRLIYLAEVGKFRIVKFVATFLVRSFLLLCGLNMPVL